MPRAKSPEYVKGFQDGKKEGYRDSLIVITNNAAEYKEELDELKLVIKKQRAKVAISVTVSVLLVAFEVLRRIVGGN